MVRENEKARARQLSSIRYRPGSDELQSILNAENTVVQPKDLVDEFEDLFSRNDKETTNQQDSEEEEVQVFEPPPKTPHLCINLDNTPEAEAPTNKEDIITIVRAVPRRMRLKLLKFHENRRPAYWGTWGKTSHTVGPRSPFGKEVKKKNKKKINRFKKCTQSLNRPYSITMSILMTNGKKKLNLVNL
jgi:hypothetical protein